MRGLTVAAIVVAVVGCGAAADPAAESPVASPPAPPGSPPVDAPTLSGMVLHLPDGPDGATIGDDSGCGRGFGADGESDAFIDLVVETGGAFESCLNQLESVPTVVESLVLSFPSDDVAARVFTVDGLDGLLRYYGLDCCGAARLGEPAPDELGDEAVFATTPGDAEALLVWRVGPLVGVVSVEHRDGRAGAPEEATRLARVQHERMLRPVAVSAEIDDDRLVGLEQAEFTPWWVGETFSPPGFPPMELNTSYSGEGMAELGYEGLMIRMFDLASLPAGSEPDQMRQITLELFNSPCTRIEPIDGPGTALLLGRHVPDEFFGPPTSDRTRWGDLSSGECPVGEPNLWMATVDVDGLVIDVNSPNCYFCLNSPGSDLPFRTPDGLRAVVAALALFES